MGVELHIEEIEASLYYFTNGSIYGWKFCWGFSYTEISLLPSPKMTDTFAPSTLSGASGSEEMHLGICRGLEVASVYFFSAYFYGQGWCPGQVGLRHHVGSVLQHSIELVLEECLTHRPTFRAQHGFLLRAGVLQHCVPPVEKKLNCPMSVFGF